MLYRFKSKNLADVVMLEPNGKRVLDIIGKDPGPQGIILPDQMPAAIAALRAAVEQEERELAETRTAADGAQGQGSARSEGVYLRQRAHPFIEMLDFCHKNGDSVVWGV